MSRVRRLLPILLASGLAAPLVGAASADAASYGSRTLTQGSKGRDVKTLQTYLTRAGHTTSIDGRFGPGTRRSVRAWEGEAGRRVDGRVTRPDARAIKADAASAAQAPATSAPAAPADPATSGGAGYFQVERATLNPDGTANAPASAPQAVKDIIAAGNEIATMPYKYGGGHGKWQDSGYDCSGSMSFAFHGAGLLDEALDSSGFARWGEPGPGAWVTTYGNGGHSYMIVAGLRFDTSAAKQQANKSRWTDQPRSADGFVERHPAGL